jgi:DNA-binding beta-propeller fold protein YncE
VSLTLQGFVDLPPHAGGGFDHGDVYWASGTVYVAHTATVESVDGINLWHLATVAGCPEASGVLCAQEEGLVFVAARGSGTVLVLPKGATQQRRALRVGPGPNGLAWDPERHRLLVADVANMQARLLDPQAGRLVGVTPLPGRPRWCGFDRRTDRFLVNIRAPAGVVALHALSRPGRRDWLRIWGR